MIEGININQRIEFISENDKTDPKTIFILKPLSGLDMMKLMGSSGEKFSLNSENLLYLLKQSVVDIKNIPNDIPKEDFISALPTNIITELFLKIVSLNNVTEEEEKN